MGPYSPTRQSEISWIKLGIEDLKDVWQGSLPNSFERLGDVYAFHFVGEPDIALFIPGSGDVLLCSFHEWQTLKGVDSVAQLGSTQPEKWSPPSVQDEPLGDLKSILADLGASTG